VSKVGPEYETLKPVTAIAGRSFVGFFVLAWSVRLTAYSYRERRTMSVDEDLVASCVPEPASFLLVAEQRVRRTVQDQQQRVREPGERPQLRLVALSAHVDDDSLTTGHGTVVSAAHGTVVRSLATHGTVVSAASLQLSVGDVVHRRHLQRCRLAPPCLLVATTASSLYHHHLTSSLVYSASTMQPDTR